MPFIQRYSDVKKGGITFGGNTLGLSKASNQNAPGTAQNFNIPADNITVGFYVRSANVTSLVQAALGGS